LIFRLRYRQAGGHIHCRLFESPGPHQTFALNGTLTFDERSWPAFLLQLYRTNIEVMEEGDEV